MKTVKILLVFLVATALAASAANIVSSVNAYQRWPWNGKVDIVYAIAGDAASKTFNVAFQIKNGDTVLKMNHVEGENAQPSSVMATDLVTGTGQHVLTWDAGADFSGQEVQNLNCYVAAKDSAAIVGDYMKIDLASGEVTTYTNIEEPAWTSDDKSAYLWLKKVSACPEGFKMGTVGDTTRTSNPEHTVKLTNDFYIGVFPVTRDQYDKIGGSKDSYSNPTGSGAYPANKISYEDLRGTAAAGYDWPSNGHVVSSDSALGLLRSKVSNKMGKNYSFDLPTEAQWEYACRAGHYGDEWNNEIFKAYNEDNLFYLGWYVKNSPVIIKTQNSSPVGQKVSSDWGFYDFHGNVYEYCLDWKANLDTAEVTDPHGPEKTETIFMRVSRGGPYNGSIFDCNSAYRYNNVPSMRFKNMGFRLALEL